jgi:hypothetical protein
MGLVLDQIVEPPYPVIEPAGGRPRMADDVTLAGRVIELADHVAAAILPDADEAVEASLPRT